MGELTEIANRMARADSYADWRTAAEAHDAATGAASWRGVEQTRIYDYKAIRARLDALRALRAAGDDAALLDALNEGVHGNFGRMGSKELYERAKAGTKSLIGEYIDALCEALEHLARSDGGGVTRAQRLDFFRRANLCFGRSALLLSGGGAYGSFHTGVVRALMEADLLPRVMSGSSAGSLTVAMVGSYPREQLDGILRAEQFEVQPTSSRSAQRKFGVIPYFDQRDIRSTICRLVPDLTFAEAFEITGLHINITVSPAALHQTSRLLNAITSPNVCIRSAVMASCAVPGFFPPVQLMAKNHRGEIQPYLPGRKWVDGSVSEDLPARRLSRLFAVNHYIVSQVNPFAVMLPVQYPASLSQDLRLFAHHSAKNIAHLAQRMTHRYGRRWPELRHVVSSLMAVWTQEYSGDVNILPPPGLIRPLRALHYMNADEIDRIIDAGQHASWPKLEMIRNATRVSRTLEDILGRLGQDDALRHPSDITVTPPPEAAPKAAASVG